MTVTTTVAIVGLDHPHSDMYLETLEALDEVVNVVLVDPDEDVRRRAAAQTTKARVSLDDFGEALARPEVTHVLIALPNDRTPAAIVKAIRAGKGVFTEKPGARSAAEFKPVRLIGTTGKQLVNGEGQMRLFPDPAEQKQRSVDQAVDRINARLGSAAVRRGVR